jgi:urease accessory protein
MLQLIEKLRAGGQADDTLTLPFDARQKTRQRVRLDSGREAALMLLPGTVLADGDRLQAADGTVVRVIAAAEALSTVRTDDPRALARACYHLGNRHVALQVGSGWARYQPDHVLDDMVRGLGLAVHQENAPFEPERGAYHAAAPGASQGKHPHSSDQAHSHEPHGHHH